MKNRERPKGYTDDPFVLAAQIQEGIDECNDTHRYDEFGTVRFWIGEMRLIVEALRLLDEKRKTTSGREGNPAL